MPQCEDFLPYYRPEIDDEDVNAVVECLRNGWLTTGARTAAFEEEFARQCDARYAIALNSCTSGLLLGLIAAGVRAGDEVVLPSLSFVAGAECVEHLGATPVFCDVDEATLCASPETISAVLTERTKAILVTHYAGRPAHVQSILEFAHGAGIVVVEDAALSTGMLDAGRAAGTLSVGAAYSFYATKNITTAEGGMFVTNDDRAADIVRNHALHGMTRDAYRRYEANNPWRYDVIASGYKCNLPDVLAALGRSQLRRLEALQARRSELVNAYVERLRDIEDISVAAVGQIEEDDRHSWCFLPILVNEPSTGKNRDRVIEAMRADGIGTSVHYIPSHLFSWFAGRKHAPMPVTERVWTGLISLPLYVGMREADVERVVASLRRAVQASQSVI